MTPLSPVEEALGFALPHRRQEEWRWTDLRRLITERYAPYKPAAQTAAADVEAAARLAQRSPFRPVSGRRIVFVNGVLKPALSTLDGLVLAMDQQVQASDDDIAALGRHLAPQGLHLTLSGQQDEAIEILHVASVTAPRALATHLSITLNEGSTARVIETYLGEGDYLRFATTGISLGQGARLERVKAEIEDGRAVHLSSLSADLSAGAVFSDIALISGARLSRQNGTCTLAGEGAEARLSGCYLLSGTQHADTRLIVDHKVPRCTSRELFKCVMADASRGIFQGKVVVRRDAQKTDGKQASHALLLSPEAEFDAKPELEIYADDVVCGHGATSGDIDHDQLFYLTSRGVPEAEARRLLVAAFAGEIAEQIGDEALCESVMALIHDRAEGGVHV